MSSKLNTSETRRHRWGKSSFSSFETLNSLEIIKTCSKQSSINLHVSLCRGDVRMIQSTVIYVQICSFVLYWCLGLCFSSCLGVIKKTYFTYHSQLIALGLRAISSFSTQMLPGTLSMLQISIDLPFESEKQAVAEMLITAGAFH